MDMYDGLAEAYDEIFPVNPATLARLEALGVGRASRVLDVGCATGSHVIELARRGADAFGVDPAEALVARARARVSEAAAAGAFPPGTAEPRFGVAGMLDFARFAGAGPFDALLCLGNTLPHLGSAAELASFLEASSAALEDGGLLVLQVLDYGTLAATRPERLAPVETGRWR
ncbi:MAG TPA: methyltransferase domain-containing protein, partial [Spirochaetales bacterium]|nr:methyltransferase domain-containing protein [Spirochaetales bacterium]